MTLMRPWRQQGGASKGTRQGRWALLSTSHASGALSSLGPSLGPAGSPARVSVPARSQLRADSLWEGGVVRRKQAQRPPGGRSRVLSPKGRIYLKCVLAPPQPANSESGTIVFSTSSPSRERGGLGGPSRRQVLSRSPFKLVPGFLIPSRTSANNSNSPRTCYSQARSAPYHVRQFPPHQGTGALTPFHR